jgi:3-oxoacyl-[acyl-carrier-protein] synthase II
MAGSDVVVTGVGAITPLGGTMTATWEALLAGKSGIRDEADGLLRGAALPVTIAAAMATDPAAGLTPVRARRLDRVQQAALAATAEAWADAGSPAADPDRFAVAIGTGVGGITTLLRQDDLLESAGARRVSPRTVPMLMPNAAAAVVSIDYGARAGCYTPVSACSSGAEAIALGARLIRAGEADVVLAGGTEAAVTPIAVAGFAQATSLSRYPGDPAAASRPFAADRDGFVLGEGAGVAVLENAAHAAARGARVRAVLAGTGIAADAHHMTAPAPDGAGQVTAMRKALAQAGLRPGDVRHVNAHATGTQVGDAAEAVSIRTVFGDGVPVTAPKASLGHLFGAAGAVEALITILSVEHGVIPLTRNLADAAQDPGIGLDVVTSGREAPQDAAVCNSFGFGGQNVALLFTSTRARLCLRPAVGGRPCLRRAGRHLVAGLAADRDVEPCPASGVHELDSVLAAVEPGTPVRQRHEQAEQFPAAFGEDVFMPGAGARLLVRPLGQQPVRDQLPEALGRHRDAQPGAPGQLVETVLTVERLAEQEHRRPGPDPVQGPLDRAPHLLGARLPVDAGASPGDHPAVRVRLCHRHAFHRNPDYEYTYPGWYGPDYDFA